jgi:hypothetical protein
MDPSFITVDVGCSPFDRRVVLFVHEVHKVVGSSRPGSRTPTGRVDAELLGKDPMPGSCGTSTSPTEAGSPTGW